MRLFVLEALKSLQREERLLKLKPPTGNRRSEGPIGPCVTSLVRIRLRVSVFKTVAMQRRRAGLVAMVG